MEISDKRIRRESSTYHFARSRPRANKSLLTSGDNTVFQKDQNSQSLVCDLFTDERFEQGHVCHTRAELRAQCFGRVGFGFGEQVEFIAALAADVTHAVVPLVVFVRVPVFAIVKRECGKLADTRGDRIIRHATLAGSGRRVR